MTKTIIVDNNSQVLLPEEIREALNIHPGDELLVQLEGSRLVLRPKRHGYAHRLRGLHKEVWKDVDATKYIRQERESWE
ncbi:MAG: AbrB/MazE/SpoVT family DNA-binding domain-containing protein [Candidatus Tectomicrobia bacterium]|uniref:AbrB/MazE/SpoVT family DNA-binding domain-containing protein n=1 Tax=Tectimicrobiota bacterium TaxID=2528274 RepID=A0A933GMM6_UNCTE|nr:AbrB/MazE/SpoVT family DNA-binding domain-containing protein [Candidatus Tectomicrobia bacterium]